MNPRVGTGLLEAEVQKKTEMGDKTKLDVAGWITGRSGGVGKVEAVVILQGLTGW